MKYIKTFEASNLPELKKYLVILSNNELREKIYYILEYVSFSVNYSNSVLISYVNTKKLYTYDLNNDKLKKNKDQFFNANPNTIESQLVYQSNDLNSAIDVVKSIKTASKYNL